MEQKVKRTKTPEQALRSLMNMAARAERCSADALRLMKGWGVVDVDAQRVLQRLVAERFIDDSRYAGAFVSKGMFPVQSNICPHSDQFLGYMKTI